MITVPSLISGFRTLADGTLRLTVDVNEVPKGKLGELVSLNQKFGFFTFNLTEQFSEDEQKFLEELTGEMSGEKSQSKRLRNVLFLVYKLLNNEKTEGFEEYYKQETERIIGHYKNKLEK